jgi:GT2 family glycosyltransferase
MEWLERGPQFNFGALEPGEVDVARNFYTSHLSVKRAAFEALGGFDIRFPFAAVEDIEMGFRMQQAGLRLEYHPELLVLHDHVYVPRGFSRRQVKVGASARLMSQLHAGHDLLPRPRWSWALHIAALPLLEALAVRPLRPDLRERVWDALALAGYARGWLRASKTLAP